MASYRCTKIATAGCMCTVMIESHGFISQDQHVMGQGYVKRKHTLLFRVVNDKNIARSTRGHMADENQFVSQG